MRFPLVDVSSSGAIRLGADVACDGFLFDVRGRVQTHIHSDHMDGFATSKGQQAIIVSPATFEMLQLDQNPDLKYRSNVHVLEPLQSIDVGKSVVSTVPNGHMLGSVQVAVDLEDGSRVGYSSDFQWPLDEVITVDCLVVDSTSGSPENTREFSQGEAEQRLLELVNRLLRAGPIHISGFRGTLHRALQVISNGTSVALIGSEGLRREIQLYRNFGYTIRELVTLGSEEATEVLNENRYVRWYGTGDATPVDVRHDARISLSAYFTKPDSPVVEYSDKAFGVALSNHADFKGTLEYIRASRARYVVTDNSRHGKGITLANEIKRRLGIECRPSTNFNPRH